MIGTLASLCDWIRDQVREVQHLTPLAVLAPTKCAPVAVPVLDEMPSGDAVPQCEHEGADCEGAASARLRAHCTVRRSHGTFGVLVCRTCLKAIRRDVRDKIRRLAPYQCCCGRRIAVEEDLILGVTDL